MDRDKIVNYRYFLSKKVKPKTNDLGDTCYPVYVQITFDGKNTGFSLAKMRSGVISSKYYSQKEFDGIDFNFDYAKEEKEITRILLHKYNSNPEKFKIAGIKKYVDLHFKELSRLMLDYFEGEFLKSELLSFFYDKKKDFLTIYKKAFHYLGYDRINIEFDKYGINEQQMYLFFWYETFISFRYNKSEDTLYKWKFGSLRAEFKNFIFEITKNPKLLFDMKYRGVRFDFFIWVYMPLGGVDDYYLDLMDKNVDKFIGF